MPRKINRILIPVLLISPLIFGTYIISAGQPAPLSTYLPFISADLSGWIGPYGGYVVAAAIDPSNPRVIYAGTWGSGVFKSLDGGLSWQSANSGLGSDYINSFAIDPTNPSTLYAGTYKNQVYKSMNGGASWIWSGTGMQEQAIVYTIAIDPKTTSTLYAGTRGASNNGDKPWNGVVYKSVDAGQNWDPVLINVGGDSYQDWAYHLAVNPVEPNLVYAAYHEHGPYRSQDYGITWQLIDEGITDYSGRVILVDPKIAAPSTLYYGVWRGETVYKSKDGGDSWFVSNNGIFSAHTSSLVMDRLHPETVILGSFNQGTYKTLNGGEYWQPSGLQEDRIYSLAIDPITTTNLIAGTAGEGVFLSQDGGLRWQPSNYLLDNADLTSVLFSPANPQRLIASVYGAGVFQASQRGQPWIVMNTGLTDKFVHALVQNPASPELIYALTDTGGLFRNNLNTSLGWQSFGQGLPVMESYQPAYPADHPFATYDMLEAQSTATESPEIDQTTYASLLTMVFALSAPQTAYLGAGASGVYRTVDGGAIWQPAGLNGLSVLGLAVDPINANLIYAVTDVAGSLKISQNGGSTWDEALLPVTFYSLATLPGSPGSVYAGTSDGIYLYQSNTWTKLGLSGYTVTAITPSTLQPGLIHAGTTTGGFYTLDGGLTWKNVNYHLDNKLIQSISLDPIHPNWAYFCTKTHGIYFASLRF